MIHWCHGNLRNILLVSQSLVEVEYRALLLFDLQVSSFLSFLTNLFICNNQSTVEITTNLTFIERIKHVEFNCHFARDKLSYGFLKASSHTNSSTTCQCVYESLGFNVVCPR